MTKIHFNAMRLLVLAFSLAFLALASAAHAESLQDINTLVKQGQHAQALERLDAYLATNPRDAQGRFLKGVVLTEMKKPAEAIAVFTRLTEDYPELPEPYNNLAVIYAQQKQYDKARQALEMAIRTHPSYATAHENLGDIYARLASQAYDKAFQLDSSNSSAQNKLALIRNLITTPARPGKATPPAAAAVKPAETPKPAPAAAIVVIPAAAPAQPAAATPAETVAKPAAAVAPSGTAEAAITQTIESWAAAWSRKDMKSYFAAYAQNFKTPDGKSRAAWEDERRKRIVKPGAISVGYENLRIAVDGDSAVAKFRQYYESGSLKTTTNKVLQLFKQDGQWLIQQERVGS